MERLAYKAFGRKVKREATSWEQVGPQTTTGRGKGLQNARAKQMEHRKPRPETTWYTYEEGYSCLGVQMIRF